MTQPITHERCSELLSSYVRGNLAEPDLVAVESHLDGCDRCRRELAGLKALVSIPVEPLSDREREHLRRRVEAAAVRRRSIGARMWPAAAALAILAGAGGTLLYLGGTDGGEKYGASEAPSVRSPAQGRERSPKGLLQQPFADGSLAWVRFQDLGAIDLQDLEQRGRALSNLAQRAPRLTEANARIVQRRYLNRLDAVAPASESGQLKRCARTVLDHRDGVLPVYAARARLQDRQALVVGFLTPGLDGRAFDGFMMLAWPQGSCGRPLTLQSGGFTP